MAWTKEQIKDKLATDDKWLFRGIVAIFNKQTEDEQDSGYTAHDNGMGFNGVDAEFLSSLALQINRYGRLSPKQIEIARTKMAKYAGQLAKIANGKI